MNIQNRKVRRQKRTRAKVQGTKERPRLSVFRSNKFIYAQVIDDILGKTLAEANDLPRRAEPGVKITKGTKSERAREVGRMIGQACLQIKINKVVFDRNGFKYTGRIKLVADEARTAGLKF